MELQELLFYGGLTAMAATVLLGIMAFVIFKLRTTKLNRLLDKEYGEREKKA